MDYRSLGGTGLRVSALSFGASPLGSVFERIDEAEGVRAVLLAAEMGINFFDCSPYYGLTKAETVLGRGLRQLRREQYLISTKVGRYGPEQFDFSAARVKRSIDESLARLGCGHIDIVHCHDVEYASLEQIITETLPALREVQKSGKVRFVGITGLPLTIFTYVLQRSEVDVVLSYCRYALNNTTLMQILPTLKEKNVGVISASPLSMGLLSERGVPDWHPASAEARQVCLRAAQLAQGLGGNISKLAIQFAVANRDIANTLVGMATTEEVRRNVEVLDGPIDMGLLREVTEVIKPIKDQLWTTGRAGNN